MPKERFLLWMLAAIFTYQAGVFSYGLFACSRVTPNTNINQVCPDLGKRYEQTFNVMITTTLALLTGNAIREQ